MKRYSLGNCRVELDSAATLAWYGTYRGWACECGDCRNFLRLAGERKLPDHILELLDDLGIGPEKATYVCQLYTDDAGVHYQFSYRLAGRIPGTPDNGENRVCQDGRCCHEPYPYGAPGFPEPHFDLEFFATLPWVLEEA